MKWYKKTFTMALVAISMLLNGQIPAYASTQPILGSDVTNYIASRSK